METKTILVTGLSNLEFLERHAQPGRIGLCGGDTGVDRVIRRAQRHVHAAGEWSDWSHAFLFQGRRADGQHWVMESDLQILRRNIQLGVQENRISKYADEKMYPRLAVLDFGVSAPQVATLLREGLERVASHERYSLRELVGTLVALRQPELRARENLLARERSVYCSAFVRQLFLSAGIELAPGVNSKHTTPEELADSPVPHLTYRLHRDSLPGKISGLKNKIRRRVQTRLGKLPHT
jgi:hypothetical protein